VFCRRTSSLAASRPKTSRRFRGRTTVSRQTVPVVAVAVAVAVAETVAVGGRVTGHEAGSPSVPMAILVNIDTIRSNSCSPDSVSKAILMARNTSRIATHSIADRFAMR
jgi:hypothetical protein